MIESIANAIDLHLPEVDMRTVRRIMALLLVALLLGLSTACSAAGGQPADPDKLHVYTSFYVLYDLTAKIGGEHVAVQNLVPPGAEPHDWEPEAADLVRLEQADLLIYNGAGMEHWIDKVVGSLDNQDLMLVETTRSLTLLEAGHGDDHDEPQGRYDPHVWLDPQNALHQLGAIRDALVQADPEHASAYNAAYDVTSTRLEALDQAYHDALDQVSRREIVVAHEAFGYLAEAYRLEQVGIEGLSSESEPDPARMAEIVDYARQHEIQVIFFEELASPKVAETIAREVGARTAVLNPLEGLAEAQIEAGEDYFSVMEDNLRALVDALS